VHEIRAAIRQATVNLHPTWRCNYQCGFCHSTFPGIGDSLGREEWKTLIRTLGCAPPIHGRFEIDKISIAGGEPTLVPFLPELLREVRRHDLVSSLITNGSGLRGELLQEIAEYLDWVALSIDSQDEGTNVRLGRGSGAHVRTTKRAVERLRAHDHVRIKLNTVVTRLNWREDLHRLVAWVRPDRWKVFQAMRVEDQNGSRMGEFSVSDAQFARFCERHADLDPVCESAEAMRGSYLMIDPRGRFFGNSRGRHVYSDPVSLVGVEEAVRQVGWSPEAFLARGGSYDWRTAGSGERS